jgi:hypothetical protein
MQPAVSNGLGKLAILSDTFITSEGVMTGR